MFCYYLVYKYGYVYAYVYSSHIVNTTKVLLLL
jgi:hypothetical protein